MPKFRVIRTLTEAIEVEADTPGAACEAAADVDWEEDDSFRTSGHAGEFDVEELDEPESDE